MAKKTDFKNFICSLLEKCEFFKHTFYHLLSTGSTEEDPFNAFANRADPDQAALVMRLGIRWRHFEPENYVFMQECGSCKIFCLSRDK